MHQEQRPALPPTEPRAEAKARKTRFQITKLEERIAPRLPTYHGHDGCYKVGHHWYCPRLTR